MRFIGNIDAKVDAKGRVFLPAVFRKILQTLNQENLIMRRDVFQDCLVLYPESIWNKQIDAITSRTGLFDRKGRELLRRFVADAESISLDNNGRFLISKRYLRTVNIEQDVRFIGVDNTIEIWPKDTAEQLLKNDNSFADDLENLMTFNEKEPM